MSDGRVLITGSSGLIGSAVARRLRERQIECVGIDLRAELPTLRVDIRDDAGLSALLEGVTGIIHLAAVSRVIHGERDPVLCRAVNVDATRRILEAAGRASHRPWVIYASSREVYGPQVHQPVGEDAAFRPVNVYAHSKIAAEALVGEARDAGLQTAIVRFSNVYGSVADHSDRVVPAFVAAAVEGGVLRVDGGACCFDLTHVDDVSKALVTLVEVLMRGERQLPPIHFVSGRSTSLLDLARMAIEIGGSGARIVEAASRTFDVHHFVGDPSRARNLLGWQASTELRVGLSRLAGEFAQCRR
jgi:nucleoside-diphosphate-sugar epimerase